MAVVFGPSFPHDSFLTSGYAPNYGLPAPSFPYHASWASKISNHPHLQTIRLSAYPNRDKVDPRKPNPFKRPPIKGYTYGLKENRGELSNRQIDEARFRVGGKMFCDIERSRMPEKQYISDSKIVDMYRWEINPKSNYPVLIHVDDVHRCASGAIYHPSPSVVNNHMHDNGMVFLMHSTRMAEWISRYPGLFNFICEYLNQRHTNTPGGSVSDKLAKIICGSSSSGEPLEVCITYNWLHRITICGSGLFHEHGIFDFAKNGTEYITSFDMVMKPNPMFNEKYTTKEFKRGFGDYREAVFTARYYMFFHEALTTRLLRFC